MAAKARAAVPCSTRTPASTRPPTLSRKTCHMGTDQRRRSPPSIRNIAGNLPDGTQ